MTIDLESDIQSAWLRAHNLLSEEHAAPSEINAVIDDLRSCIERVREAEASGERELWWLIRRLAGRTTESHTPTYLGG